jgi:hypothetical protein
MFAAAAKIEATEGRVLKASDALRRTRKRLFEKPLVSDATAYGWTLKSELRLTSDQQTKTLGNGAFETRTPQSRGFEKRKILSALWSKAKGHRHWLWSRDQRAVIPHNFLSDDRSLKEAIQV